MIPPKHNAHFVWRMEAVLDLYEQPYDARRPVVCFDERPVQLHSHIGEPEPMRAGEPRREDYEYKRQGTCSVLVAFEPLRGWRTLWVLPQRRKVDFAACVRELAEVFYAEAEAIRLVCDNLNTHDGSSFYEAFEAEQAHRLAQRVEFVYTPKHGSWLNMAEIELSALSRQCLSRRLPSIADVVREVAAWQVERNAEHSRVDWQFTTTDARIKLKRLYPSL